MRKDWKWIAGFLAFLVLSVGFWWADQQNRGVEPSGVEFVFSPPFPPEVVKQYSVPPDFVIEEVHLAGTFNNWVGQSEAHKFRREGERWVLRTVLPPGQISYKFVVQLQGRRYPVWTYDPSQPMKVDDGYGGFNSLVSVGRGFSWLPTAFFISAGACVLFLLYGVMEKLSLVFFRYGMSDRTRTIILVWLAAVYAIGFSTVNNLENQRQTIRTALVDDLNLFHLFLKGDGWDPLFLTRPEMVKQFNLTAQRFFSKAEARNNPHFLGNSQTFLRTVFLFDPKLNLLTFSERDQEVGRTMNWMTRLGADTRLEYYRNHLLKPALDRFGQDKIPSGGAFGSEAEPMMAELPSQTRWAAWILGFDFMIVPVVENQVVKGYYGALIHPEVFQEGLFQTILSNLIWVLGVTLTIIIYFFLVKEEQNVKDLRISRFISHFGLSAREAEILALLVAGASNQEISTKFSVTEGTVKVHVHRIFQKAGVGSRMELMEKVASFT